MDTSVPARLPRDYLCGAKLNNYADGRGVLPVSRKSTFAIAIRGASCVNAVPHPIGLAREGSRGSRVKIPLRSIRGRGIRARNPYTGLFLYLMSSQFPRTSPVGSSLFRALRNNGGKVGRTVSTFRKAESTCILVDDGTLLVIPLWVNVIYHFWPTKTRR